jgi:hypothetical protein
MKNRFRLIQRGRRGGTFYSVDSQTGRRESLGTKNSDEAVICTARWSSSPVTPTAKNTWAQPALK